MPEIKNMFQKGVMNKDLDERLVPNGQYRDAMNVQVSTSEGSEVGTVQNILGNIRVDGLSLVDFKCIGAVTDEKNDVLYWFVTSPNADAIIEYHDNGTVTPILVDVNKDVLKFDRSNIITGINIIDNLLFWTDDVNEPKKINIDTFKLDPNVNLLTHSTMFVNGNPVGQVTEDHITVIRKRPQKAPRVVFSKTAVQPTFVFPSSGADQLQGTGDDMNFLNKTVGSEVFGVYLQTDSPSPPYNIGDRLFLSEISAVGNLPQNYQTKLEVMSSPNAVAGGYTYNLEILEIIASGITNVFADGISRTFNVVKEVDKSTIFEKEFIRFATRYKYADGEYSAFSPFTQPVFLSGVFGFHPTKDPYNLGMENKVISITLQNLVPTDTPDDVVQLDILFKKERSTTIYSIDSIKPNDPTPNYWSKNANNQKVILGTGYGTGGTFGSTSTYHEAHTYDYTGEYEITTENIYAALPSNQMLRPWDNVPRKALAQEVTANRVVYANYLQNYDFKDSDGNPLKPLINVSKEERSFNNSAISFNDGLGKRSIKSLRTYYLGVVYGDKYGRETPVFTSKDASIHIPHDLDDGPLFDNTPDKSLRLTARLIGEQPEWADYYKYFIKQTTGEYYNLTLDRVYKNENDQSFWLSFPSSDRNKVQEGDYFSVKKQVDLEKVVPEENKIKIIDIKNEAPDSIKYNHTLLGTAGRNDGYGLTNFQLLSDLFPAADSRPKPGERTLQMDKFQWMESRGPDLIEALTPSDRISIQFMIVRGGSRVKSKKYLVAALSFNLDAAGGGGSGPATSAAIGEYTIVLKEPINQSDSWITSTNANNMNDPEHLVISVFKIEEKDAVEFSGRFFVKTVSNAFTQRYLIGSISDLYNYEVLAQMDMFNLADTTGDSPVASSLAAPIVTGVYNVQGTWVETSGNGISDTEAEWDSLTSLDTGSGSSKGFFLDSAGYVALANTDHVDAYDSGSMNYEGGIADSLNNGFEGVVEYSASPHYMSQEAFNSGVWKPLGSTNFPPTRSRVIMSEVNYFAGASYSGSLIAAPGGLEWTISDAPSEVNNGDPIPWLYYPTVGIQPNGYTYPQPSPFFIHWSYSCPGVNLHNGTFGALETAIDNDWPTYTTKQEFVDSFFKHGLQKIKATKIMVNAIPGQAFTLAGWDYETATPSMTSYNNLGVTGKALADSCFDPGSDSLAAEAVVNSIEREDARFMIDADNSREYNVISVNTRNVYNHTPWNITIGPPDGVQNYHAKMNTSVTIKLQNFFTYLNTNGYVPGAGGWIDSTEWEELKITVENFGNKNNRRRVYVVEVDEDPRISWNTPGSLLETDATKSQIIRFITDFIDTTKNNLPTSPAVFETEAKEDVDLNIYYEASDAIPIALSSDADSMSGHLLGPVGSKVTCSIGQTPLGAQNNQFPQNDFHPRVVSWEGDIVEINNPGLRDWGEPLTLGDQNASFSNKTITFWREDLSYTTATIDSVVSIVGNYVTKLKLGPKTHNKTVGLPYYNCFSFGNGVESNRIRDDYNESFILNGVKASTVLEEPYEEERRKYGLIYSGLYNSTSGVNNLNQFIQAEKITKDLMPSYGSIQKLYARDKDLITLCEDKIIRIYVDKDILYNADGNTQLLATNRVLGTAEPFRGNFGISKNPESFAAESFRAYFTDKQRGAVIRLSMDGLTPISDAGMHDYFRDNLRDGGLLYGSYDSYKEDYNLTINQGVIGDLVLNPTFEEGFTTQSIYDGERLLNGYFNNVTDIVVTTAPNYARTMHYGAYQAKVLGFSPSGSTVSSTDVITTSIIQWEVTVDPGVMIGDTVEPPGPTGFNPPALIAVVTDIYPPSSYPGTYAVGISTSPGVNGAVMDPTFGVGAWPVYDATLLNIPMGITGNWYYPVPIAPGFEFTRPQTTVVTGQSIDDWAMGPGIVNYLAGGNRIVAIPDNGYFGQTLGNSFAIEQGKTYQLEYDVHSFSVSPQLYWFGVETFPTTVSTGIATYEVVAPIDVSIGMGVLFGVTGGELSLNSISLKEKRNYGGNVADWDLVGVGTEIYTEEINGNEKITFDQAAEDTHIHQNVNYTGKILDFNSNVKCDVKFNLIDYSGTGELTFRLYNNEGDGFEHTITSTANGLKQFTGIIGNLTTTTFQNKFGFYVSSASTFTGTIDNIEITLDGENTGETISFNENAKGWTSFKSFVPEVAISSVNQYYTMNFGQLWKHHTNETRNTFYGIGPDQDANAESSITPILNMQPALVKNFNTLNYEGSQSKVDEHLTDGQYYNLETKPGWYVSDIHTNKQEGTLNEFIEKEGKWFNYIKGKPGEIDTAAFNFQGLGIVGSVDTLIGGCMNPTSPNFDPLAVFDDGSCAVTLLGCLNPLALNYFAGATIDDGSCTFAPGAFGLQVRTATSPTANDGAARVVYTGTNVEATGFTYAWSNGGTGSEITGLTMGAIGLTLTDSTFTHNLNVFIMSNVVSGCTNPIATNFNYSANTDDGTCII